MYLSYNLLEAASALLYLAIALLAAKSLAPTPICSKEVTVNNVTGLYKVFNNASTPKM